MLLETSLTVDHSYSMSESGNFKGSKPSESVQELRKSLTLDFTSPENARKSLQTPEVLNFLKLSSPELEKLITQGVTVVTTPTPTQFIFPKNVTNEQEQYARGFIDALNSLHQQYGYVHPPNLLSPSFLPTSLNSVEKDEASKSVTVTVNVPDSVEAGPESSSKPAAVSAGAPTSAVSVITAVGSPPMQSQSVFCVPRPFAAPGLVKMEPPEGEYRHAVPAPVPVPVPAAAAAAAAAAPSTTSISTSGISTAAPVVSAFVQPHVSAPVNSVNGMNLGLFSATAIPATQFVTLSAGSQASLAQQQRRDGAPVPVTSFVPLAHGSQGGPVVQPAPVAPIDMDAQEKIKLERKRARNRVAATKCRRRKLERISTLEQQVRELNGEKMELSVTADQLREDVSRLRSILQQHRSEGCAVQVPAPLPRRAPSPFRPFVKLEEEMDCSSTEMDGSSVASDDDEYSND